MDSIETKHLDFPLHINKIDSNGEFSGYASVFNVIDDQKDVIVKGAFVKTLREKGNDIKLLWQHRQDEPIGIFNIIKEDAKGLFVQGKLLLDVRRAQEAYALIKSGALNGLSIGYKTIDSEADKKNGVRVLKEVELFEISLVTFPSNPAAKVTRIKSQPQTVREFEDFLRDAGFSRKQAKQIASSGFSDEQRDAVTEEEIAACRAVIAHAIKILTT